MKNNFPTCTQSLIYSKIILLKFYKFYNQKINENQNSCAVLHARNDSELNNSKFEYLKFESFWTILIASILKVYNLKSFLI